MSQDEEEVMCVDVNFKITPSRTASALSTMDLSPLSLRARVHQARNAFLAVAAAHPNGQAVYEGENHPDHAEGPDGDYDGGHAAGRRPGPHGPDGDPCPRPHSHGDARGHVPPHARPGRPHRCRDEGAGARSGGSDPSDPARGGESDSSRGRPRDPFRGTKPLPMPRTVDKQGTAVL